MTMSCKEFRQRISLILPGDIVNPKGVHTALGGYFSVLETCIFIEKIDEIPLNLYLSKLYYPIYFTHRELFLAREVGDLFYFSGLSADTCSVTNFLVHRKNISFPISLWQMRNRQND